MTYVKVIAAIVFSLLLLYIAKITSEGRPKFISHTENGFTFEMTTVPSTLEASQAKIPIKITGNMEPNLHLFFRSSKYGQDETTALRRYSTAPLFVEDSAAGLYYAMVSTGARGRNLHYYFEIRDDIGGYRAGFLQPDGKPFKLMFIGHVSTFVLVGHIFPLTATVFFVVMGSLCAIPLVRGKQNVRPMSIYFFLATLAAFLGTYPFGFAMNHYAYGTIWEGVPFGTDATDNKTQLLFVFLLFVTLASIGSFARGKNGRNIYPPKALGWFGLLAFAIMLVIYLIPHSIQFSPELTKAVCYSFIGLVGLLYIIGWLQTLLVGKLGTKSTKSRKWK